MTLEPRHAVLAVVVVFVLFLLYRMRPSPLGAARGELDQALGAARKRISASTTPRERAAALCDAGTVAAAARRYGAAAGYFLRALRVEPTWTVPVERAAEALEKRPRLLEKMLIRQLGRTAWDDAHRPVVHALATTLTAVYERQRDRVQASVMRRVAALVAASPAETKGTLDAGDTKGE